MSNNHLPSKQATMATIPLQKLTSYANPYAAANGLQVEKKRSAGEKTVQTSYQCAPISLLPNAFPAAAFNTAKDLAPYFNELVDRISRDGEFFAKTLGGVGGVISADAYTRKLFEMYNAIYLGSDGEKGKEWGKFARMADRLGIQRSDYMLHKSRSGDGQYELKQVELNTIASSFAGLAVTVAGLHRQLTSRFKKEVNDWLDTNTVAVMGDDNKQALPTEDQGVPVNPALTSLSLAMSVAHERYRSRFLPNKGDGRSVILFVVQDGETNTVDQRMLEFKLWENHEIPVVRISLTRAHAQLKHDEETGALFIVPDENDTTMPVRQEVSLVYFRAGYAPTDYPDGDDGIEWKSREIIERSRATKCPCLGYHLSGTKKVQQELARPGVLERFFDKSEDKAIVEGLKGAFAGLYSLGEDAEEEDIAAVKAAISGHAGRYVLKPQREGGGYNFYGDKLTAKLKENVDNISGKLHLGEKLAEYILMERLFPPQQRAVLLRAGVVEGNEMSISELGCFGTVVANCDGDVLHNEYAGFLLRTKFTNVDEGGVASGFATLSSPYLC